MSKRFRLYWNVKIAMYSLQNAVVISGICNILYPVYYWYPMESRDVKIWGSEMAKGKSTKKIHSRVSPKSAMSGGEQGNAVTAGADGGT